MERDAHSRASVYCDNDRQRERHIGVVIWLDEVIAGFFRDGYIAQAHQALGINQPPAEPEGGTPWMESDGL